MVLYRLLADKHLLGHFLVLETLSDQRDDLALPLAEGRTLAFPSIAGWRNMFLAERELAHNGGRSVRIQPDFPCVNFSDTLDQQICGGLLEHDARGAEFHGLDKFSLIFGGREYDDFRVFFLG